MVDIDVESIINFETNENIVISESCLELIGRNGGRIEGIIEYLVVTMRKDTWKEVDIHGADHSLGHRSQNMTNSSNQGLGLQ